MMPPPCVSLMHQYPAQLSNSPASIRSPASSSYSCKNSGNQSWRSANRTAWYQLTVPSWLSAERSKDEAEDIINSAGLVIRNWWILWQVRYHRSRVNQRPTHSQSHQGLRGFHYRCYLDGVGQSAVVLSWECKYRNERWGTLGQPHSHKFRQESEHHLPKLRTWEVHREDQLSVDPLSWSLPYIGRRCHQCWGHVRYQDWSAWSEKSVSVLGSLRLKLPAV